MQIISGPELKSKVFYNIKELVDFSCTRFAKEKAFAFRKNPKSELQFKTYQNVSEDYQKLGATIIDLLSNADYNLMSQKNYFAIIGDNSYEWVISYLSIVCGLGICVPIDKQLPANEVTLLVKRAQPVIFFFSLSQLEKAKEIKKNCPFIKYFICLDKGENIASEKEKLFQEEPNFLLFSDLLKAESEQSIKARQSDLKQTEAKYPLSPILPQDIALLLFTSGTTEEAKGVMLSHENICTNVAQINDNLILTTKDRLLSVLPLHHTFENTAGFLFPFSVGASIYYMDGLRYLAKNLQEWEITAMIGVPLLFENIYKRINDKIQASPLKAKGFSLLKPMSRGLNAVGLDFNRLIFRSVLKVFGGKIRLLVSGASAIKPEVIQSFRDFGIDFRQGYGMTETSPVMTISDGGKDYSVGRPLSGIKLAIDTEEDYRGAIGEILTSSKAVMQGYFNNQAATEAVLTNDGFLRTGDLGYFDQQGCLHITGRCKHMIVLQNGKKIFPEEIESVLDNHSLIKESFVWGDESANEVAISVLLRLNEEEVLKLLAKVPPEEQDELSNLQKKWQANEKLPEEAFAFIQQQTQQIINLLGRKLPAYKKIKYVFITREEFIKTTTLKVKRREQEQRIKAFFRSYDLPLQKLQKKEIR